MNKPTFKKYNSIENADRVKVINHIMQLGLNTGLWQVTLKVHGANFCFVYNGNGSQIESGKRSGFINSDDGTFHNYQNVLAKYQDNILSIYEWLQFHKPKFTQLTLFGELFGGLYDHPDVPKDPHASRVQKGVYYCPHNDFYLFDIVLDGIYISKSYIMKAVNSFGFVGAEPLYTGTFEECLKFEKRFNDPLHQTWNLPPVEGDNICEGVVIEPVEPTFFPSGSRVILKNKNEEFCEKASHRKPRKVQLPHEWSTEGTTELEEVRLYITENRLRNVLSHMGEVTDKMFGKLLGMFAQDVFKSYLKDRNDQFSALDKKEQDLLKKTMQRECSECIRPNFRNIMDGEF